LVDGGKNLARRKLRHAAVMTERAGSALARAARHRLLKVDRVREKRLGPADVRWAEEGNDRHVEGRREVAGTAIGRDQDR
jgi:hypothetical protein